MHRSSNRDHALAYVALMLVFVLLVAAHLAGIGAQMPAPGSSEQAVAAFARWRLS